MPLTNMHFTEHADNANVQWQLSCKALGIEPGVVHHADLCLQSFLLLCCWLQNDTTLQCRPIWATPAVTPSVCRPVHRSSSSHDAGYMHCLADAYSMLCMQEASEQAEALAQARQETKRLTKSCKTVPHVSKSWSVAPCHVKSHVWLLHIMQLIAQGNAQRTLSSAATQATV